MTGAAMTGAAMTGATMTGAAMTGAAVAGAAVTAIDCTRHPVDAALKLARVFTDGGRLVVRAPGRDDHAHHVAVEFVHPVIAGARPLPAAVAGPEQLTAAERPGYCHLLIGSPDGRPAHLWIPAADLTDAEVMIGYHLLWELVQVALEHPGLVGGIAAPGGDSTGFLYPFLDAGEQDEASLRAALAVSARSKQAKSKLLAEAALRANRDALRAAAAAVAGAVGKGGRVLTMGNGGSATDAARLARLLEARGVPAHCLAADYAVLSAMANDLGAERLFSRQLEALARAGDVLIGCSTSGASANLLAAFDRAAALRTTAVGISGYGGGSMRGLSSVDHCLCVDSDSVHRIQEAQAALITELCDLIRPEP